MLIARSNHATMSVSYAPTSLKVPDGFGRVLEDLTREVLRIQPDNIYEFAADHFKGKLLMRERLYKYPEAQF
jgi:hypothetical protein